MDTSLFEPASVILRDRDPSDPGRRSVELAQRGRMILDVAKADLEASEAALGPFHPTTWHFRNALAEARKSWDRLRAEFGLKALEQALNEPPVAVLRLPAAAAAAPLLLLPIEGKTYRAEPVAGTAIAPVQWRLTRLDPPLEHGPYYACLLRDGSTQCDCAEWTYRPDGPGSGVTPAPGPCKHLAALAALGWLDASRRWEWNDS
jgi:hypothetical protein